MIFLCTVAAPIYGQDNETEISEEESVLPARKTGPHFPEKSDSCILIAGLSWTDFNLSSGLAVSLPNRYFIPSVNASIGLYSFAIGAGGKLFLFTKDWYQIFLSGNYSFTELFTRGNNQIPKQIFGGSGNACFFREQENVYLTISAGGVGFTGDYGPEGAFALGFAAQKYFHYFSIFGGTTWIPTDFEASSFTVGINFHFLPMI